MTRRVSFLILVLIVLAGYQPLRSQHTNHFNGLELVDKTGNIQKPADYRDHYELLGTYTVLDPKGNQMHVTYATPGTAEYYRKTGKFPDGAVLVKEVHGTDHARLTTGDAYWASGIHLWFVQIKDEKHRFADNKLWGMDGAGRFSKPMLPTIRSQLTTRRIASAPISRPGRRT
jgi:hypothetical protein